MKTTLTRLPATGDRLVLLAENILQPQYMPEVKTKHKEKKELVGDGFNSLQTVHSFFVSCGLLTERPQVPGLH